MEQSNPSARLGVEVLDLPLLKALSEPCRGGVLQNAVLHTVAAGTILFEQGDMPTFQHVVLAGSIHLLGRSTNGREVLVETVEPPDMIIPAAVVSGLPYLMRARVPEPSRLLLIQAETFRRVLLREPLLAHEVIGSLAGQFRRMVRQIKNLKLRSSTERVGCHIVALSRRQGTPHRAILPYEKHLIASQLGMTRESFSRALAALQREGVTVEGDRITIRDPKYLAAVCQLDPLIDTPDESLQVIEAAPANPLGKARAGRADE